MAQKGVKGQVSGPVAKFPLIKINSHGRRQNRTLAVSSSGVQNMSGSSVQWFLSSEDVYSVLPDEEDKVGGKKLVLTALHRYTFEAESNEQRDRVIDAFQRLGIGVQYLQDGNAGNGGKPTSATADPASPNTSPSKKDDLQGQGASEDDKSLGVPIGEVTMPTAEEEAQRLENLKNLKTNTVNAYGREDFEFLRVIGKGSFGKVMQVKKKDTGKIYAMKILKKKELVRRSQVEHTRTEQMILANLKHPFMVNLHFSFQTDDKLYMVLDFVNGGELFFHLGRAGRFPESLCVFYLAEIILSLDYLHQHDIIYRDLKPENVLLDADGHVRLCDFGLSKTGITSVGGKGQGEVATTFCGTPEYLAPEIITNVGHGKAVDWWSLGILLFELLTGAPPFYSENRNEMYLNAVKAEIEFPPFISKNARDLLSKLLVRRPEQRLGSAGEGVVEIKRHPFFKSINWEALEKREMKPPFKPRVKDAETDLANFDESFTNEKATDSDSDDDEEDEGEEVDTKGAFQNFTFVADSSLGRAAAGHSGGANTGSGLTLGTGVGAGLTLGSATKAPPKKR